MDHVSLLQEDWEVVKSLLPRGWEESAKEKGAIKRLRGFKCVGDVLRVLLLHTGKGYSLRETSAKSKATGLTEVSDVALMKRLKKSAEWLKSMCHELMKENHIDLSVANEDIRLFDATVVTEKGKTGSQWRIHYSMNIPALSCDYFKMTATKGKGSAESFKQYVINEGDYIMADRCYGKKCEVGYAQHKGAKVLVRAHLTGLQVKTREGGHKFPLLKHLKKLKEGEVADWPVYIDTEYGGVYGRLCAVKKSKDQIEKAMKAIKRRESKKQKLMKEETKDYAKYIVIFTTFPDNDYKALDILNLYRLRWQIELIFKRFKSLAQLGHLPKKDPTASKAWLYAKLLLALLIQKFIRISESFSPWGYLIHTPKEAT